MKFIISLANRTYYTVEALSRLFDSVQSVQKGEPMCFYSCCIETIKLLIYIYILLEKKCGYWIVWQNVNIIMK